MTALATRETQREALFTESDIQLIKQTVARDATDEEFAYFLRVATLRGLNPLLGQIRLSIYNRNDRTKRSAVIVTTIHGFRLIASRTGRYAPGPAATFIMDEKTYKPIAATAYVKVYHPASRTWIEYSDTAYWDEYSKTEGQWVTMPRLMLAKCAEALALRRGFPEDLSGMYTDDEMDQAERVPPHNVETGEIVDAPTAAKSLPPAAPTKSRRDLVTEWLQLVDKCDALGIEQSVRVLPPDLTPATAAAWVDKLRSKVRDAEAHQPVAAGK